jgi:hypothetical protein
MAYFTFVEVFTNNLDSSFVGENTNKGENVVKQFHCGFNLHDVKINKYSLS